MRILVVGGAGYIGGGVTDILLQKGLPFSVYDNLLYEHQHLKPVDFIYGDVRDREKLKKILPKYTHVVWLAAIVGDAACQVNPSLTVEINQESVKWLADNFDGRIIFTSTCSIYGQHNKPVDESAHANPLSLYAQTKLQAEKYLSKTNSLIFRLGTAYGISDGYSRVRMDLVVNYMTANAIIKGKLNVYGGVQWRPLIHVNDIAAAIVHNVDKPVCGVYNLATSNYQIKVLAQVVSECTGCGIEYTEQRFEDERNYQAITEKAVTDGVLNLIRIRDVKYGVREIADIISSGKIKYSENDIYFNERHLANLMKNGELN